MAGVLARAANAVRVSRGACCTPALSLRHNRWFSSQEDDYDFQDDLPNKQDFVKVKLEPGEWDTQKTDPIHKPPWKNKARTISAEDYANRPRAGFDEEFASPHDAMLVLSWLDRANQEKIYHSYLNFMKTMSEKETATSHEYVMRVLAQKYNISSSRVAAVVQLLHNEDQIRRNHPEQKIYYETQDYVDARIAEHIANCYDAFKQPAPTAPFIEDPMAVTGLGDIDRNEAGTMEAGDELDVDDLLEKAMIREQREMRLWIDSHVYVEDVDEDTVKVKTTGDCQKLMKAQEKLKEKSPGTRPEALRPLPENGQGKVRPRWKYMAETINTRELGPKKKYYRPRNGKTIKNAIVEQDGNLRVASVKEVKNTCWKPERNLMEFTFNGVKQAWLERTLEGKTEGWGHVDRPTGTENVSEKDIHVREEVVFAGDLDDDESLEDVESSDDESEFDKEVLLEGPDGDDDDPDGSK